MPSVVELPSSVTMRLYPVELLLHEAVRLLLLPLHVEHRAVVYRVHHAPDSPQTGHDENIDLDREEVAAYCKRASHARLATEGPR